MTRTNLKWPGFRSLMAMLIGAILLQCGCTDKKSNQEAVAQAEIESYYTGATPPIPLEEYDVKADLAAVKDNLCFIETQKDDAVQIGIDYFLIPNSGFGYSRVEWTGAYTEKGKTALRIPTAKEMETERHASRAWERGSTLFISDKKAKVVSAKGILHLSVPTRFQSVAFSAGEVGETKRAGSFDVTLQKCQGDQMVAKISNNSLIFGVDDLAIYPRDKTGKILQLGSYGKSSNEVTVSSCYGRIASFEIFYPSKTIDLSFPIVATSKPELAADYAAIDDLPPNAKPPLFDKTKVKLPTPRYAYPFLPTFVEIDEATLNTQIKVTSDYHHLQNTAKPISPKVIVMLPRNDNSAAAQLDFGNPELFDSNNRPLQYKPLEKATYIDRLNPFYTPYFASPTNSQKPVEYSRVVGKVKIHYPVKLKMISLTTEQPTMEDVEAIFWGQKVLIRSRDGKPSANLPTFTPPLGGITRVRAYDANGRRLEAVDATKNIFWGEPRAVKYFVVEKWIDREIPYDLSATPKAPVKGNKAK